MSADDLRKKKSLERERFQKVLEGLSFPELMARSSDLRMRFASLIARDSALISGRDIVSFCPFENEPQINIESEARDEPYQVAYVRIEDWNRREMSARRARRDTPDLWEEFELGKGRTVYQPRASRPYCEKDEIAIILVPGLAFTQGGERLGRGAGFYDRFLRLNPSALRVGIAFEVQLTPKLPFEEWDERVDIVLTDQGIHSSIFYEEWQKHGKIKSRIGT